MAYAASKIGEIREVFYNSGRSSQRKKNVYRKKDSSELTEEEKRLLERLGVDMIKYNAKKNWNLFDMVAVSFRPVSYI